MQLSDNEKYIINNNTKTPQYPCHYVTKTRNFIKQEVRGR